MIQTCRSQHCFNKKMFLQNKTRQKRQMGVTGRKIMRATKSNKKCLPVVCPTRTMFDFYKTLQENVSIAKKWGHSEPWRSRKKLNRHHDTVFFGLRSLSKWKHKQSVPLLGRESQDTQPMTDSPSLGSLQKQTAHIIMKCQAAILLCLTRKITAGDFVFHFVLGVFRLHASFDSCWHKRASSLVLYPRLCPILSTVALHVSCAHCLE